MRVRTHPGEVLRHEFLDPLDMSATSLAAKLDVPANRISEIVRGRRDVTADTALRLAAFFDTTPEFWMNLQVAHDLSKASVELTARHAQPSKSGGAASKAAKVLRGDDNKGASTSKSAGKAATSAAKVLKEPGLTNRIRKLAG